MSTPVPATRRERLRQEAMAEIRTHGYAQIELGGAAALSLNGIAKAMGMSGAAMYRYFPSRDALLATLIAESYEDLAGSLETARTEAHRRAPRAQVLAVADAYRAWALAQPHRYRLVFGSALSGADPERIIPAAQRAMDVILGVLGATEPPSAPVTPPALARELGHWGQGTGHPGEDPSLYLLAQTTWTRLHGIVSLEIEGVYAQMGIDPAALYAHEVSAALSSPSA
jgi:AcrR family transcriptional regulator